MTASFPQNPRFMIQRIQTLWLVLAGALAFLTIKFPTYGGYVDSTKPYEELNGMSGGLLILLLTIIVGVLACVAVALYRNRKVQTYLCFAGIAAEGFLCYLYKSRTAAFVDGMFSFFAIFHLLVIVFFILALAGIRKDEKLVRESDRLR